MWITLPKRVWELSGLVHEPDSFQERYGDTRSQKAEVDTEWNKFKMVAAWDVKKVRSKSEVVRQRRRMEKTVNFAHLMDPCHLKNAELADTFRNTRSEWCSGRTTSTTKKDRAVFTDQGASASQMATAKFLDTISKVPGMTGVTGDAVWAFTQVKMTEAPRLFRLPQEECPELWIRIPPRQRPKGWDKIDDLVVPLERNFYLWSTEVQSGKQQSTLFS